MQLKYLSEIDERFSDALVLQVPMFDNEIKGLDMLDNISKIISKGE